MKKITIIITSLLILGGIIFYSCKKDNPQGNTISNTSSIIPKLQKYIKEHKNINSKKNSLYDILSNGNNPYDNVGIIVHNSIIFTNANCNDSATNYSDIYSSKINTNNFTVPDCSTITTQETDILKYNLQLLDVLNNGNCDSILIYLYNYVDQTNLTENFIIETGDLDESQKARLLYLLTITKNTYGTPVGPGVTLDSFYDKKLPKIWTAAQCRKFDQLLDDCCRDKVKAFWDQPMSWGHAIDISRFPVYFMTDIVLPCNIYAFNNV